MGNFIYGLFSTMDDKIRYVGKTSKTLEERLYYHIYGALKRKQKSYKDKWIRKVYKDGFEVQIKEIEKCTETNINEREIYWINFYKTSNKLTNQLLGGESGGVGGKIINFLSYEEAKSLINELSKTYDINSISKYRNFLSIHTEYKFTLPKYPNDVYKFRGTWISWRDYLNSDHFNNTEIKDKMIKYDDLKKIIIENGISTKKEYLEYVRKNKNYNYILPSHPERIYKNNGWISYKDFLCDKVLEKRMVNKYTNDSNKYYTLKELKLFLKPYKFRTVNDCLNFIKEINNEKIPKNIVLFYKAIGQWTNWNDLLNLKKICNEETFIRYIKFYHLNDKIKTNNDWNIFMKQNSPSMRISYRPELQYKKPLSYFFEKIPKIKGKLKYNEFLDFCVKNVDESFLKTRKIFHDYVQNNNLREIPVYPSFHYKKNFSEIIEEILTQKKNNSK